MQKNDLLLLSSVSPIMYGVYSQGKLIESFESKEQTLNTLIQVHKTIVDYEIGRVFYASGPGSFTAIKLTHIFLQTLSIVEGIELFCTDTFFFNANAPIKAFGKQYFVKNNNEINLEIFEDEPCGQFRLPQILKEEDFGLKCEPLYILPAV